ncbi:hypothetical protein E4U22_007177, partial [Claviceps purpurea]
MPGPPGFPTAEVARGTTQEPESARLACIGIHVQMTPVVDLRRRVSLVRPVAFHGRPLPVPHS